MNHSKAFTLLEVLLVVTAIGILSTIVIVAINPIYQLQGLRDAQRQRHVNDLNVALTQYVVVGNTLPEDITVVPKEVCDTGEIPGDEEPQPDCGSLINLSFLVPAHISGIPSDPAGGFVARLIRNVYAQTFSGTGYVVAKGQGNRPVTQAPKSERRPISSGQIYNPYSLDFDGVDGYVNVPSVNPTNAITVEAWVKSATSTGYSGVWQIVSKYSAYILGTSSSGGKNMCFIIYTTTWRYGSCYTVPDPENWHHFVGTYDSSTGVKKLYVDGIFRDETTPGGTINPDTGPLHIGHREGVAVGSDHFNGLTNNTRIYNRALSEQEIQNLYSGIHIPNGLVGWWNFNEGEGITTEDLSGNGNHGTLEGGVTWSDDTPD